MSHTPEHSERQMVEACVANDRRSQEQLYRLLFPAMFRMCMRYTSDKAVALEIINAGFLRVFQKLHTFSFNGSLEGWVRRIVFHSLSDHFGKQPRRIRFLDIADRDSPVSENALSPLYFEDIVRLTDHLPTATREVFWLYAVEGYSHGEIAQKAGISVGTSKWHLSEARKRLRQMIEPNQHHTNYHAG